MITRLFNTLSTIAIIAACTTPAPAERANYSEIPLPPENQRMGTDPAQIALTTFGIEDPVEGNLTQDITLVEQTPTAATVSLTQTGLLDDSVEGIRYRLEFAAEDTTWILVWAGRQVRCYPGRGSQDWTTDLCI